MNDSEEYVTRHLRLRALIRNGLGDSYTADVIRKQMDTYWNKLSSQQQLCIRIATIYLELME